VPWPLPQTLKIKKYKNTIVKNLLPEFTKMHIFIHPNNKQKPEITNQSTEKVTSQYGQPV